MRQRCTSLADLGREVARLRKAKGLTQKELGALVGMGQSTLARFETGNVAEFGSRKLLRLLEVMGHGLAVTEERPPFTLDDALRERRSEIGQANAATAGLGTRRKRG
jgi:HTH-type transcriptional regulator/antitoxin HipB